MLNINLSLILNQRLKVKFSLIREVVSPMQIKKIDVIYAKGFVKLSNIK